MSRINRAREIQQLLGSSHNLTERSDTLHRPEIARARNVARGLGSLTVQNVTTSGLSFIFLAIVLRLLPTVQYGVYSAIVVVTGIASTTANFGLGQTMARYLALLRDKDERLSWYAARKILYVSLVISAASTLVCSILSPYFSLYFTGTTRWTGVFLLAGVFLFLTPLSNLCQGIIQGLKNYVLLAKMIFLARLATVVLCCATLIIYRDVTIAISAWILFCAIIVGWVFALTYRNLVHSSGEFRYSEILRYAYPLGIAGIVSIIASSSDQIIVGGYLSAVSLGVYTVAVTLSTVLTQVLTVPLTTAVLPEFSSSKGEIEVSNGLRLALRFIVLIVLPASLLVADVSGQLIRLFSGGGAYLDGISSLEVMAMFYVFVSIQLMLLSFFQAVGKTRLVFLVGLFTAATDIGSALTLVPTLGLEGAAFTKALVGLVGALSALYLSRNYLRKLDSPKFYSKCIVASIVPFVATFVFSQFFSGNGLLTLLPCAAVYAGVFLVCVRYLKLLNNEDRSFFTHVVPSFLHRFIEFL